MAVYDRGYKSKGYDLFISNHSNASDSDKTDYPVVIRAYDNKNNADVLGKKLTDVITKMMNTKQPGRTWTRKHNNGEYYGVLRGARASGCPRYYIIEHSFHTNLKISTWLLNESNLKSLAKSEVEAIATYYKLKKKGATAAPENPKDPSVNPGKEYIVKVNTDTLNVRKGPSTKYDIVTTVHKWEAYTIVDTNKSWGKLKSGIGWINLDYTKKK